jgi:hypothetical protein
MPPTQSDFATGVGLHTDAQEVFVDTIKSYQSDDDMRGDDLKGEIRQDCGYSCEKLLKQQPDPNPNVDSSSLSFS